MAGESHQFCTKMGKARACVFQDLDMLVATMVAEANSNNSIPRPFMVTVNDLQSKRYTSH